jgi:hypothetical protein
MTKCDEVWREGFTLLDDSVAPYISEQKPQGIISYQQKLFLLGRDTDKRLELLQIQE